MLSALKLFRLSSSVNVVAKSFNPRNFASHKGTQTKLASVFPCLLEPDQALQYVGHPQVKFIDASWHLGKPTKGHEDYLSERIVNAQHFDLDEISDKKSHLPHMLPNEIEFANAVSKLGISSTDQVIIYASDNAFSAARVWWTFKVFGHQQVSILNGGLNGWKLINGPMEYGHVKKSAGEQHSLGNFKAKYNPKLVVTPKDICEVIISGNSQILDARSAERFQGKAPEPRAGCASGHIPSSLNLHFAKVLKDNDYTTFKSPPEIKQAFDKAGIIIGSRIILSCGSGVTAATLCFALHLLGKDLESMPIYDGSWSEWGTNPDLPKFNPADPNNQSELLKGKPLVEKTVQRSVNFPTKN